MDVDDNQHEKEDEVNDPMIESTTTKTIDPIIPKAEDPPPSTVEGQDKEREDNLKKIDDNIKENYSPTGEGAVPQSELKEI
jgi:hypothetical protein